jgi:hypothetical protein
MFRMARKLGKLQKNFRRVLDEAPLHSPLGQWMARHRAQFAAVLGQGEPDWVRMAAVFRQAGL